MFAFNCPVDRRRPPRPALFSPSAVLAVAMPGFLVTACSGQTAVSASPDGATVLASAVPPAGHAASDGTAPGQRPGGHAC